MKRQEILFLAISIFILVIAWLIFTIIHNARTSTISEILNVQIVPISPQFDQQTIETLKQRQQTAPLYQLQGVAEEKSTSSTGSSSAQITPSPKVSVTPTLLLSPTVIPTTIPVTPTP